MITNHERPVDITTRDFNRFVLVISHLFKYLAVIFLAASESSSLYGNDPLMFGSSSGAVFNKVKKISSD